MRYLRLLKALFGINFSRTLIYKGHFIAETINSVAWGALSIITILLLTQHISTVFGWTRNELILLAVVVNIIYGLLRLFFDINFWRFSEVIHTGELDAVLLKPVDSQFHMSLWFIDIGGILRFIIAVGLTIYLLFAFHFAVTLPNAIFAIILCVAGVTMLYSITYIFLTVTIWYPNLYNLMNVVNGIIGASRYPKEMYISLNGAIFFLLLPIIIIISTPTKSLLGKANYFDSLLLILFTIIFFSVSRVFWKFALRFYTSASG
ncbi:MAG: ABC transporter permease [Candidatus Levyibacteriota bacterium]